MKNKVKGLKHEEDYVSFLRKRLNSANFKEKASVGEVELTKRKYDKAKLKLKMVKAGMI